jgi:hypothetical protein
LFALMGHPWWGSLSTYFVANLGFDLIWVHMMLNIMWSMQLSTLPSQWFLAPARLYAYQPLLQVAPIPDVSSKEGAVLGARKFHRWHQTHE